jgi:hypothetical protein
MTSETDNDVNPPDLSMHPEKEEYGDPLQPADREFQLKMTRLRIKELEMQIELERILSERTQSNKISTPDGEDTSIDQKHTHLSTSVIERQQELPKREIQHFDGDPKHYWSFMRAFQNTIESRTNDDEARLSYLIQYCDGPTKAHIQHCTVLDPSEGYLLAKEILRKRFGQNYMVARAFIDDLLCGPFIVEGDSKSLMELAQKLMVCDVTLKQLSYASDLNSRTTIQALVAKLPSRLRFKWAKVVANIRKLNREPEITDLASFIEERVEGLYSDYGELAVRLATEDRWKKRTVNRQELPKQMGRVNVQQTVTMPLNSKVHCSFCGDNHYSDNCSQFINMNLSERRDAVRRHKLCIVS